MKKQTKPRVGSVAMMRLKEFAEDYIKTLDDTGKSRDAYYATERELKGDGVNGFIEFLSKGPE